MLIVSKQEKSKEGAFISLSVDKGKWKLNIKDLGEFIFDPSLLEFKPDIAYLSYSDRDGFFLSWSSEIAESRSGLPMSFTRRGIFSTSDGEMTIASFWVDSNGKTSMHTGKPCYVEHCTEEVIESPETFRALDAFADHLPEAKVYIQRVKAKKAILSKINELSVLAALEAQLDLVTQIVLNNFEDPELKNALLGVSTLDIHNKNKLIQTVRRQKKHLRELQAEYFNTRGSSINSDPTV